MLLKFITLLTFLIGCVLANTAATPALSHNFQVDYNQLLLNSVNYLQKDASRYQDCFAFYEPLLRKVGNNYKVEVSKCNLDAEQGRFNMNHNGYVVGAKAELASLSAALCGNIQSCNESGDDTKFFQCIAMKGSDVSRASNNISYRSNEFVGYIENLSKVINVQENVCINTASATYTSDWSILSDQLEKCFQSTEPVFTTTPSTTEPTDVTTEGTPITEA